MYSRKATRSWSRSSAWKETRSSFRAKPCSATNDKSRSKNTKRRHMGAEPPCAFSWLLLIQVNRLDRHLQFIFPLHRFFELLIDHLHAILFLHEGLLEPVLSRFLILLHFLERVFK